MSFAKTVLLSLVFTIILSGCGIIKNRSNEYISASHGKALIIPPGLDSADVQPSHPVPRVDNRSRLPAKFVVPAPPNMSTSPIEALYQVQTVNTKTWLLVQYPPGKVWPKLQRFLLDKGITLSKDEANNGQITTQSWANSIKSSKFMKSVTPLGDYTIKNATFYLTQGIKRTSSELKISLVVDPVVSQDQNLKIEQNILNKMVAFFKTSASDAGYSLLANDLGGGNSKISMFDDKKGNPVLKIDLGFDRTWTATKTALALSGISLVDVNRSAGKFYINYVKKKDKSWFYWLLPNKKPKEGVYDAIIVISRDADTSMSLRVVKILKPLQNSDKKTILSLILKNIT